jgi:hypothetical protein
MIMGSQIHNMKLGRVDLQWHVHFICTYAHQYSSVLLLYVGLMYTWYEERPIQHIYKLTYSKSYARDYLHKLGSICTWEHCKGILHKRKFQLNKTLYSLHINNANTWGNTWDIISRNINNAIESIMKLKYNNINTKLKKLKDEQIRKTQCHTNTFYQRIDNLDPLYEQCFLFNIL